ncbi:hypothetical protein Tco_1165078 [Tanacetum coccineum]
MAEENIPAPTRSGDQLLPVKARLPYGKSNLLLDLQKLQKSHIFRISVKILHNTNFFMAFTASANIPSIYIQQFWNTLTQEAKSGVYSFQLDEQWFPLNADLLREALEITPPWRAMLTLINQCLTGKTYGSDKPRHPGIQTFFSHQASLSIPSKKSTPYIIPYCQFTKMIIYYLGSRHNIHRKPESSVHVTGDDFPLGNLKFVSKGENDEVFGKPIPKELITEAIQQSPYYQQYLEMATRKPTSKESVKKKTIADKGKVRKVQKGKSSLHLVDEDEKAQPEPEPQVEDEEYDLQRVTEEASTRPLTQPKDDTSANIVCDTPSPLDAETCDEAEMSNSEGDTEILNVGEEKGEDVSNTVALEERIVELDEGRIGSDLGVLDNSTSNVLIPLDSWTSGLLVYKLPLAVGIGTGMRPGPRGHLCTVDAQNVLCTRQIASLQEGVQFPTKTLLQMLRQPSKKWLNTLKNGTKEHLEEEVLRLLTD